jgi:hypothetical protein
VVESVDVLAFLFVLLTADLSLPAGPAARAWARVEPGNPAIELPARCASAAYPRHWDSEQGWRAWAERLGELRASAAPDPARSAELALSALSQGRGEDAWHHFSALSGHPEWCKALAPYLVVGGPRFSLDDGALFAPALPPLSGPPNERILGTGRLEPREWWLRGIEIGKARVDVQFAVETTGLKLVFHHLGGGDARLRVVFPEPLDMEFGSVYVDWEREPQAGGEHEVLIAPEVPILEVFASLKPVQRRWPTALPPELDARAKERGFEILVGDADATKPRASGLALALTAATGLSARVVPASKLPAPGEPRGIALEFAHGPERARKLRGVLSALEQYAQLR